jgi:predicted RNA methylase
MNIQGLLGLVTIPKWRQRLGDISTPKIVVDNLISHLEEDPVTLINRGETILDPCCGHGSILIEIARMSKNKIDPMKIAKHLYGYDIKHAATTKKLLANELGIDVKFINVYEQDSLEIKDMNISNFRVVMNPPFNEEPGESRDESGNSNNSVLYQRFVEKFAGTAKQVVSLNPAGWTIKKKDVEDYKKIGLSHVEFLPANHFPTVTIRSGLTISNFVKGYTGDITVTTEQGSTYTQDRTTDIKNINQETRVILSKLRSRPTLNSFILKGTVVLPKGSKSSIERACEIEPKKFKTAPTTRFCHKTLAYVGDGVKPSWLYSTQECDYAGKYKIVVSGATSKYFLGNVMVVEPAIGVCKNNFLLTFNTSKEAVLYKNYLDSTLIKFVLKNVKFNDVVNTNTNSWSYIPQIPIREIAELAKIDGFDLNEYLYTYFEITDDERKIIES